MKHRGAALAGLAVVAAVLVAAGCGSSATSKSMTLYTCTSENVEQAVVKGFEAAHPGTTVKVFRAATGQLNARVAADLRTGGIQADAIWACDPLTMYNYDRQGLLGSWRPPNSADIPAAYQTAHFTGIDLLYMVLVVHRGAKAPATWAELTAADYKGKVTLPSPSFAASAFGMLGYLSSAEGYGVDYFKALKANHAVQVSAPGDALTAVEQGSYQVGATLANAAYADRAKGSPIEVVWPKPGGISIYAPIGITTKKHRSSLAASFADYAASVAAQKLMAAQNTYPTLPGLGGPPLPPGSPVVSPNWPSLAASSSTVLARYSAIFGT